MEDRNLIPVKLPNDAVIFIDSSDESGREPVSGEPRFKISDLKNEIEGISLFLVESLQSLSPSKIAATFSVEIDISEGKLIGIFAKASSKGSVEISLEWNKENSHNQNGTTSIKS